MRAAAAHKRDNNTPSGPTGRGVEKKNCAPKNKIERRNIFFLIKNFNHAKIEAANPSSIKLICCGLHNKHKFPLYIIVRRSNVVGYFEVLYLLDVGRLK